jgi:hypothetical protein
MRLAEQLAAVGGPPVVLLTNDQAAYEQPPPGVARALIKARTTPAQLSDAIKKLTTGL